MCRFGSCLLDVRGRRPCFRQDFEVICVTGWPCGPSEPTSLDPTCGGLALGHLELGRCVHQALAVREMNALGLFQHSARTLGYRSVTVSPVPARLRCFIAGMGFACLQPQQFRFVSIEQLSRLHTRLCMCHTPQERPLLDPTRGLAPQEHGRNVWAERTSSLTTWMTRLGPQVHSRRFIPLAHSPALQLNPHVQVSFLPALSASPSQSMSEGPAGLKGGQLA